MPPLSLDLSEIEAVALDIETTGLEPEKGDDICEIAAVHVHKGEIGSTFTTLIKPAVPVTPEAFAVNQISEEMLKDAPTFSEKLPAILDAIGSRVLVIHNAPFDLAFFQKKLLDLGRPLLENPVVDTLIMARTLDSLPGQNSLGQVAQRLQIPQEGAHRALDDTIVTAKIFAAYLKRLLDAGKKTLGEIPGACKSAAKLVQSSPAVQIAGILDVIRRAMKDQAALDIFLGDAAVAGRRLGWVKVLPTKMTIDGILIAYCPALGKEERFAVSEILKAVVH
jgi:DNA polymerase III epsilon subunit family exonuclease